MLLRAAVKQRKIAISLAVVGAIAAPFVLHTYKMHPKWPTWIPLTAEYRQQITADLASCSITELSEEGSVCYNDRKFLKENGFYAQRPSMTIYLLMNAAVAVASFGIIFGLTYLLPAVARRYWRWLNT